MLDGLLDEAIVTGGAAVVDRVWIGGERIGTASMAGCCEAERLSASPSVNVCCSGTIRTSRLEHTELLTSTLPETASYGNCTVTAVSCNC